MIQPRLERYFSSGLTETRKHRKYLTQRQLAGMLKEKGALLNQAKLSQIETGARRVSLTDAYAIADALGTTPEELVKLGRTL